MKKYHLFLGNYDYYSVQILRNLANAVDEPIFCLVRESERVSFENLFSEAERTGTTGGKVILVQSFSWFQECSVVIWYVDLILKNASDFPALVHCKRKANLSEIDHLSNTCQIVEMRYVCPRTNLDVLESSCNVQTMRKLSYKKAVKTYVFPLPIYCGRYSSCAGAGMMQSFVQRVLEFVRWVSSRIPAYFQQNALKVLAHDDRVLPYITSEMICFVLGWKETDYEKGLFQYIQVPEHGGEMIYSIVKRVFACNSQPIELKTVGEDKLLNSVDRSFKELMDYYFPEVIFSLNQGAEKEKGLKRQINSVSFAMFPAVVPPQENAANVLRKRSLRYYSKGDGDAIVIMNAYGVDTHAWESLVHLLAQRYRVIYWNARGVYDAVQPENASELVCGISSQVEDIFLVAQQEKLESFHLMSWCSGAKAAVYFQNQYPEKVKSQIFVAGEFAPFQGSEPYHSKFRENIQMIARIVDENSKMLDLYMKMIQNGMFNHPLTKWNSDLSQYFFEIIPPDYKKVILAPFSEKEAMIKFLKMCMEYYQHDVTNLLSEIQIPTTFISAKYDQVAPFMQSMWAHQRIADSCFVCIPAATHLMVLERYYDLYQIINQHIELALIKNDKRGELR